MTENERIIRDLEYNRQGSKDGSDDVLKWVFPVLLIMIGLILLGL